MSQVGHGRCGNGLAVPCSGKEVLCVQNVSVLLEQGMTCHRGEARGQYGTLRKRIFQTTFQRWVLPLSPQRRLCKSILDFIAMLMGPGAQLCKLVLNLEVLSMLKAVFIIWQQVFITWRCPG